MSAFIPLWASSLQPASWRGLPFQVEEAGYQTGRRVAVHEYPLKDSVYAEDLGLAKQQLSFAGFLIGDDVFDQRDAMVSACNTAGSGTLNHPSLGSQTASLVSASFSEGREGGNTVKIQFTFVLSTAPASNLYPTSAIDTQTDVANAADDMDSCASDDFLSDVGASLAMGADVVSGALGTVTQFTGQIQQAVNSATRAVSAVRGIGQLAQPTYWLGRYANGNISTPNPILNAISGTSAVIRIASGTTALLQQSNQAVAAVQGAINSVQNFAETL